jgi:hypothetical protein
MWRQALSKVATVMVSMRCSPSPRRPGSKPKKLANGARPLVEQHARGHETERGNLRACHGGDGQRVLPEPVGKDRGASTARELPGRERGFLIGAQFDGWTDLSRARPVGGHLVHEPDASLAKLGHQDA